MSGWRIHFTLVCERPPGGEFMSWQTADQVMLTRSVGTQELLWYMFDGDSSWRASTTWHVVQQEMAMKRSMVGGINLDAGHLEPF